MNNMNERVVALVDMDCFYCQVEVKLNPELKNKPLAVVQYNYWKGGGIIAVNYEAKARGVNRHMRGDDAKKQCPEIELVRVPEVRGKAGLSRYRDASRDVAAVLCQYCKCVEKASIDEAYLDLTEDVSNKMIEKSYMISEEKLQNTHVVGYDADGSDRSEAIRKWIKDVNGSVDVNDENSLRLAIGAQLVEEIRSAIYEHTGFHCSAGIANNKILAKLACGLHKPKSQTVLSPSGVPILFESLSPKKIRGLGGKFGDHVMEKLGCSTMGEISTHSLKKLQKEFDDKMGLWLYNISRGIDVEPVENRMISKSIGCCKQFKGPTSLKTKENVEYWIKELASEAEERLQDDFVLNKRKGKLLTVTIQNENSHTKSLAKSCHFEHYKSEEISQIMLKLVSKFNAAPANSTDWEPPITLMGLSVSKFDDVEDDGKSIRKFFKPIKSKEHYIPSIKDQNASKSISKSDSSAENASTSERNHKMIESKESLISPKEENNALNINSPPSTAKNTPISSRYFKPIEKVDIPFVEGGGIATNSISQSRTPRKTAVSNPNFKPSSDSFFLNYLKSGNPTKFERSSSKKRNSSSKKRSSFSKKRNSISSAVLKASSHSENIRKENDLEVLREMFPDLRNINASVVDLLPQTLQKKLFDYLQNESLPDVEMVSLGNDSAQNNLRHSEMSEGETFQEFNNISDNDTHAQKADVDYNTIENDTSDVEISTHNYPYAACDPYVTHIMPETRVSEVKEVITRSNIPSDVEFKEVNEFRVANNLCNSEKLTGGSLLGYNNLPELGIDKNENSFEKDNTGMDCDDRKNEIFPVNESSLDSEFDLDRVNNLDNDFEASIICAMCGKEVVLKNILEHEDYHVALQLQASDSDSHNSFSNRKNILKDTNKNRKRNLSNESAKPRNSITNFFSPM